MLTALNRGVWFPEPILDTFCAAYGKIKQLQQYSTIKVR